MCQEERHATYSGVIRSRRNRERKRSRKGVRLESGLDGETRGEAENAKSEQTDASTGRPKEAGAASAFPFGRWNPREVFLLEGRQLGRQYLGRGIGNGRRMRLCYIKEKNPWKLTWALVWYLHPRTSYLEPVPFRPNFV